MRVGEVRGFFGQGNLDGGWAPGDEGCEAAFADAEEGFVDLCVWLAACLILERWNGMRKEVLRRDRLRLG